MYRLFQHLTPVDNGQLYVSELNYIRSGMRMELAKILKYYHTMVTSVGSDHVLVRLIQSLPLQLNYDYTRYVDVARDAGDRVGMSLQFTSPLSVGQYWTSSRFYSQYQHEILISDTSDFDIVDTITNWRDAQPVRVLSHPFTDFSWGIPNGRYPSSVSGLVSIAINIPMLMLQYRRWVEVEKSYSGDANKTLMQFVSMYVLPNMLSSHIDHCFFNRLSAISRGDYIEDIRNSHPFNVINLTQRIDGAITRMLERLGNRVYDFNDVVKQLPLPINTSLWDIIRLPSGVMNRQVEWAYALTRLPLIHFLLMLNRSSSSFKNMDYINQIRIDIARLRNDRGLMQRIPKTVLLTVEDAFERSVMALL